MQNSSLSEKHGIDLLLDSDMDILSVGISTGGEAEIRMAKYDPRRRIVATTLDKDGAEQARAKIAEQGMSEHITVKVEDVAGELPYEDNSFDYVYARLVLHYLTVQQLEVALASLYRVLRPTGRLFVAVRSTDSLELQKSPTLSYDEETHFTTYQNNWGSAKRYFHTKESISDALQKAGFTISAIDKYEESLTMSFDRAGDEQEINSVIEVVAEK